ncbi:MAG: pilus assembly protein TadG-related protein [Kiritimatiellia bacterium]|nr:pilus assembly protein TadG-related protein [Kiritimatiellia bacterium]
MNPFPSSRLSPGTRAGRSGQTLLFLMMLLVILTFVVLFVFDVHKTLFVKYRAQNAGDAAALAGARWQGIALNLIGELNVLQAVAISDALARDETVFPEAEAIADLAARLNFVGPMTGLAAAQQAAKQNRVFTSPGAEARLRSYAARVRSDYPGWFQAPFGDAAATPNAWEEYAEMIQAVVATGIAAEPATPGYGFIREIPGGHHILFNPSFYAAIRSRNWCWFHFNAMDTLRTYQSWADWPSLPLAREQPINSEFLGLGLQRVGTFSRIAGLAEEDRPDLLAEISQRAGRSINPRVGTVSANWFCYNSFRWTGWAETLGDSFPFETPIRSEYNVTGADAVLRVENPITRITPGGAQQTVAWGAAAKPFGTLDGPEPAHRYGLVLPAFTDVRLIPVSASSSPSGGGAEWATHMYEHLPDYVTRGLDALQPGCSYCQALQDGPNGWENPEFRAEGLQWLSTNSASCVESGGPGGPGGGSRIGH